MSPSIGHVVSFSIEKSAFFIRRHGAYKSTFLDRVFNFRSLRCPFIVFALEALRFTCLGFEVLTIATFRGTDCLIADVSIGFILKCQLMFVTYIGSKAWPSN